MGYVNMGEMLASAKAGHYAIGAFNTVDAMTTEAVIRAAEEKRAPVIIQTSAKTVKLYGAKPLAAMVIALAKEATVPVAMHLDHCKEIELIRECIAAGWSSVMIDASSKSFEENVALTAEVVALAHPQGVTVEGELGAIVGVEDDIFVNEADAHLADPEQSVEFVERTGVDVFAPAIGTAHGVYKGKPVIAFDRLEQIAARVPAAVAIHGGTGLSDEVFHRCISLGGAKVNVSTQIKHAFRDSLSDYFEANPTDYEPVKVLAYLREQTKATVATFIETFGSAGTA